MTEPKRTGSAHQPDGEPRDPGWAKDQDLERLFALPDGEPGPIGYDRLLPAVTSRIAQRRRRRRTGIAVVAAAVVLAAGGVAAHAVSEERDHPVAGATDGPGLTITYGDHVYTFTRFTHVACITESGHELLQAWFRPEEAMDGTTLVAPILSFDARPDLVAGHQPRFDLPEAAGDSQDNAFTLFAAVPVSSGTSSDDNEASSQEKQATGTVTITHLTCGADPAFTIVADAELGSEVRGPTIPIQGRISYPAPQ